jgi:hypothetical protein
MGFDLLFALLTENGKLACLSELVENASTTKQHAQTQKAK